MDFNMKPYIVYVKTDEQDRITRIDSSALLQNTEGWTEIDSGYGDKYHHAQSDYLGKPIFDTRGIFCYKLVDGKVVERTQEEMDADYDPPAPASDLTTEVEKLKAENARLSELILSMI